MLQNFPRIVALCAESLQPRNGQVHAPLRPRHAQSRAHLPPAVPGIRRNPVGQRRLSERQGGRGILGFRFCSFSWFVRARCGRGGLPSLASKRARYGRVAGELLRLANADNETGSPPRLDRIGKGFDVSGSLKRFHPPAHRARWKSRVFLDQAPVNRTAMQHRAENLILSRLAVQRPQEKPHGFSHRFAVLLVHQATARANRQILCVFQPWHRLVDAPFPANQFC